MPTITKMKGNNNYKIVTTKDELVVLNIAVGLLGFEQLQVECEEQGVDYENLEKSHFKMFEKMCQVTKLYPVGE